MPSPRDFLMTAFVGQVEKGVVGRVGGNRARHCRQVRPRGFAAHENLLGVDVVFFGVAFQPRERLVDVFYRLGVRVIR